MQPNVRLSYYSILMMVIKVIKHAMGYCAGGGNETNTLINKVRKETRKRQVLRLRVKHCSTSIVTAAI